LVEMVRRITAAALILLAACGGRVRLFEGSTKALNYAQYCSLEEGMQADAILRAFGPPGDVREEDGKVRGLAYPCEDSSGKVLQLRMAFNADAKLEKWVLKDPKAPEPSAPPAPAPRAAS
jgi:hypothetical protein